MIGFIPLLNNGGGRGVPFGHFLVKILASQFGPFSTNHCLKFGHFSPPPRGGGGENGRFWPEKPPNHPTPGGGDCAGLSNAMIGYCSLKHYTILHNTTSNTLFLQISRPLNFVCRLGHCV